MWADAGAVEVKAVWASALGRFSGDTLRVALQNLEASANSWPPTLPEFLELCRQAAVARVQHAPATMLPAPDTSPEVAAAELKRIERAVGAIGGRPSRMWAHRILERAGSGGRVLPAVLSMAKRAVGASA